jgi:hypothetical protein
VHSATVFAQGGFTQKCGYDLGTNTLALASAKRFGITEPVLAAKFGRQKILERVELLRNLSR